MFELLGIKFTQVTNSLEEVGQEGHSFYLIGETLKGVKEKLKRTIERKILREENIHGLSTSVMFNHNNTFCHTDTSFAREEEKKCSECGNRYKKMGKETHINLVFALESIPFPLSTPSCPTIELDKEGKPSKWEKFSCFIDPKYMAKN